MRRLMLGGFMAAILTGILLIGLWWTKETPVVPPTPPDTTSTPR